MKPARREQPSFQAGKIRWMAHASMRAYFVVLKTNGKTRASTPETFYGFQAADVLEMYFHKRGSGNGLWYRLKDGRIIDALGKPSRRARSWYSARAAAQ
jgi:hypothetical protein